MLRLRTCLLVLLVSCVKSNDITVRTSPIDDRSPEDTGDDYDFQHLPVDGYVLQKPGFYAVHGASDWVGAWTPGPDNAFPALPASVDFKSKMLFIATSKTPGAKSIEVQKITRTADGLHVYVLETLLAATCVTEPKKGAAMDIVSLDNVPYDMHVVYNRVHAESCGPPPDAVVQCRVAGSGSAGTENMTAVPGENIDCDSSQSRPQVGQIIKRTWQLNATPPGSASKLTVGKGNIGVTFPVDAWGVYQVGLDIRDATRDGSGLGVVEVLRARRRRRALLDARARRPRAAAAHRLSRDRNAVRCRLVRRLQRDGTKVLVRDAQRRHVAASDLEAGIEQAISRAREISRRAFAGRTHAVRARVREGCVAAKLV